MKTVVPFITVLLISLTSLCQSGPELVFSNPVLVSGTANKQGAVYRFNNVTTGVDAQITLKKFSRTDIVMATIDNADLGWNKALQPEFGLSGLVAPNQNWYIDFELSFYRAGTNVKQKMDTVDLTALDVDGDGRSISEYVTYDKPNSILYSTTSYLTHSPVGGLGQVFQCDEDGLSSPLITCVTCGGDGIIGSENGTNNECPICGGTGVVFSLCGHPYTGGTGSIVNGPINNFVDIDTSATQVMATYQFLKTDKIRFRYGAKSAALSSNGSGIRLNSTWFRKFSLAPQLLLPVKLVSFDALLNQGKIDLKWATASEINVSHFAIEKSYDGKSFSDVATVFAFGNTTENKNYSYADNIAKANNSIIYYRLRCIDIDGKFTYSEIRVIRFSQQADNAGVLAYPNPFMNELRVTLPHSWQNKEAKIELFNANGQLVKAKSIVLTSQTETINTNDLGRGFYVIRITSDTEKVQYKVIKN
jgi:Secretion system C-terminal sorting domain